MNEKPFLIIRTMSDNADDSASMTYDEFKPFAADQSAKLIIEMLKESGKFFASLLKRNAVQLGKSTRATRGVYKFGYQQYRRSRSDFKRI